MSENIRLQPRDIEVLKRVIDFNGLPASAIIKVFFESEGYGYRRLKQLEENGYLEKTFYYSPRKKDGKVFTQRIGGIYYAAFKCCWELGYTIDPRFVVPDEKKLDVTNLIGKLFAEAPDLLSKRQAVEKYGLKNFMPITCVVPNDNPIFIYIYLATK